MYTRVQWDGEKLTIYHFTVALHAKFSGSHRLIYCNRKYMGNPVIEAFNNRQLNSQDIYLLLRELESKAGSNC